ncbi:MAG TPA: hypothetical protein VGY56_02395 [Verrucomicrobiae bacterium]|nr:hypothetical protein [Verrucomicrobiae bacterium]
MKRICGILIISFCLSLRAQLSVTVAPPQIAGQKVVVELTMTNGLSDEIKSARAICLLLNQQGRMVGQSTKWVIGQNNKALEPNGEAKFNFVITTPRPLIASNLTAKVMFSRVNLVDGKEADVRQAVEVMPADKSKAQ